jgi:Flp pilus assembly protein TadB
VTAAAALTHATPWAAALCAAASAALALRPTAPRGATVASTVASIRPTSSGGAAPPDVGWMRRWRWLLAASAAVGALTFVGGVLGAGAAPAAATLTWIAVGRAEPSAVRRAREEAMRELPHVVRLLGLALAAGTPPAAALEFVAEALPGAASEQLGPVAVRLRLGADPVASWAALSADPALAPLARSLARAEESGLSIAASVARLADDLARSARTEAEQRARAVGVKAAAPLGLCLLPAFLLIGIVPLVGGLLTSLRL